MPLYELVKSKKIVEQEQVIVQPANLCQQASQIRDARRNGSVRGISK